MKESVKKAKHITCWDDLLYFKKDRLCILSIGRLRLQLLHECHDTVMAGHLGWEKTYE